MRPLYENQIDLSNEAGVVARLCAEWGCQSLKLPMQYRVDFAITKDSRVKAWLEVKCRSRLYSEMILSAGKFMAGQQLAQSTDKPFVVAFCINDHIYWRDCSDDQPEICVGGRTDRGDWQDTEPIVMLPFSEFRHI